MTLLGNDEKAGILNFEEEVLVVPPPLEFFDILWVGCFRHNLN
jgi:hypothetical protein